MRLLITADLHFNHGRSRPLAEQVIARMNSAGGDAVLVVGDTAAADGDDLERCLSLFRISGPRLLVAGNHELWTRRDDSHSLFKIELPQRVRSIGWQWLQDDPLVVGETAIVGSIGWYDYSFAPPDLGIPRRFYEHKVSPGAAQRLAEYAHLLDPTDDIAPHALEAPARWNDGKLVKLGRSDEQFLGELLGQLREQLVAVAPCRTVIAAVHHVPFRELLPPSRGAPWDFARAYLGSDRIGSALLEFPNVRQVFCGHSHFPGEAKVGAVRAINIGSGYRWKTFHSLDL